MGSRKHSFNSRRSAHTRRHPQKTVPSFEQLEPRALLAVAPLDFLDRFVAEGSGGLHNSRGLTFGPDANGDGIEELYVSSGETNAVLRFDGATGSPFPALGKSGADFISPGSGGLDIPSDLAFGPDNNLYVSSGSANSNQVIRYDSNGNNPVVVVSGLAPEPGSPQSPFGLTFDGDGNLYIANLGADEVLRFDGTNVTPFVTPENGLDRPFHAVFGPAGNLYVNSWTPGQASGSVLQYDSDGNFMGTFATTAGMGDGPMWIEFGSDGYLYASVRTTSVCCETSIVRFDAKTGAFFDRFDLRRDGWSFTLKNDPTGDVVVYNSTNGHGGFVDRFVSSLGPDSTKFYVVDDGRAVNQTYEYGSTGSPGELYPLASNNNSPRGAAISGFTTLVVDANKNIYVYDPTGDPMGSWTAGGVPSTAQFEGIAVNHLDVWLVDANQDRVYQYDHATTRTKDSQSSSGYFPGNFPLNPGNTNPQGIADPPPAAVRASASVSDSPMATVIARPITGLVPDDFLTKSSVRTARRQRIVTPQKDGIPSHLADQVMNVWKSPGARGGDAPSASYQLVAASHRSARQHARFGFEADAGDQQCVDRLESAIDLMVPDLPANGGR